MKQRGISVGYLPQQVTLTAGSRLIDEALRLPPALAQVEDELLEIEAQMSDPAVYGDEAALARVSGSLTAAELVSKEYCEGLNAAAHTAVLEVKAALHANKRRVLMRQPGLDPLLLAQACQALGADGVPVEVINDSPGFVAQRVLAGIVNLGCEIAQRRIASPAVLDRAVQLALGYPHGPLGFGELFGAARVEQILHELHEQYQEPRYRVSPWLRRRVQLGLPLTTPEDQEPSA